MATRQRYLEKQLQKRESEASELRRNLHELRTKFFQLERAFETNLQVQTEQEVEFNRTKHEIQELRKLNDEIVQTRTVLNSRLMNTIIERDHWKNAFLRQRDFITSNKTECSNAVALVKRECEDILKMTRETTEKQFHELLELYNKTKEKATRLEEEIEAYQISQREHENRSFELANLLETLKRFDVDVDALCQLVAEALKNLTEPGNLFENGMKNLRQLTWIAKDKKDESELTLLREQNSVLKEVVKNLKRKVSAQQRLRSEILEREKKERNGFASRETKTINDDLLENCVPTLNNSIDTVTQENHNNVIEKQDACNDDETIQIVTRAKNNRRKEFDSEDKIIDKCGRVICIESHSNGLFYEEYIFKLSVNREIKLKYPVLLNNNETVVKMEFVDDEAEYEGAPLDRILIFFKNIHVSVNVKQTGVPCGTQTTRMKTSSNVAQTTLTGINSFSRLNVGVGVSKQIFDVFFCFPRLKTNLFAKNRLIECSIDFHEASKNYSSKINSNGETFFSSFA
ncbi:uncharacterized protein LOC128872223 [Hylaeus volcanicus]|uniref:uncharacterized protein LOC128872223 n=1 Tax=Hylaeus volcanicus TaxID=313075 RepID=UPI0023B8508F|nr:uncharacterized protein LOC128872223 [Hylaeus volcanicus]